MSTSVLKITNLEKTFYPRTINENHVLKGINLDIKDGEFVTIIGGNGAGKSTLLNAISGTIIPDVGTIEIGVKQVTHMNDILETTIPEEKIIEIVAKEVTHMNAYKRSKYIGRVFQDPRMGTATRLTIEENMSIALRRGKMQGIGKGVKRKDRGFFIEQLAQLGLGLEDRLTAEIGLLSGGQRQAVTLLMATLHTPDILLLDEHTAALDPKTSAAVLELTDMIVRQKELTTLMITHNMEDAIRYGNRLIMLHEGRIVVDISGDAKQSLTVPDLLQLFHQGSGSDLADDALLLG